MAGLGAALLVSPLLASAGGAAGARTPLVPSIYRSLIARLRPRIADALKQQKVAGLSIALVDGPTLIRAEGFGHTDLRRRVPVTAMTTAQFPRPRQVGGGGLGIDTAPWLDATLTYHRGNGYGFSADQRWSVKNQVGVIVLSNAEHGLPVTDALANEALTGMVEAKFGAVPPTPQVIFSSGPAVVLDRSSVARLAGTYGTRGSVIELESSGLDLLLVAGRGRLEAYRVQARFVLHCGTANRFNSLPMQS